MAVYIYTLKCPDTQAIRYVGKTAQPLDVRLNQHLTDRADNHRTRWLRKLATEGKQPIIELIEVTTDEEWVVRERWWIAEMKAQGCRLVNGTIGGDGIIEGRIGRPKGIPYPIHKLTRMDAEDAAALRQLAAAWRCSESAVIRRLIREELARRAGLE